ncbi:hypothetical protein [Mesorhizobium sp.]|nr:hypothetical protein [Mesorhizobium sp.]RWB91009.1 MAG: hypothetical protein EOQ52_06105 [Mesorhizobium sp.]TGS68214.1 hypothetical protein EN844_12625 [Mesorhizobium sp. M3A.F.Ca.ET.201.01.1.1]
MVNFVPPGHVELRTVIQEHGGDVEAVRRKLFSGELEAVRYDEYAGRRYQIFPDDWSQLAATYWLETGRWSTSALDHVREPILVVKPKEEAQAAVPSLDGIYLSPFMVVMIEAIKKFDIQPDRPPPLVKTLEHFFLSQPLPGGKKVTRRMAEAMATAVRPLEAMGGGNPKRKG